MSTKIEWADEVWNPVTGCDKVSPGCTNCYAKAMCRRFWKQWDREPPPNHFKVKLHSDRLEQPLHWRKPRRVFVCSMGDLFHEDVPSVFVGQVWMTMAGAPQHTFQVLTKRPERMIKFVHGLHKWAHAEQALPNVWLGVTAENQQCADERIPRLLQTPAAVRFVSVEPMLGPIKLWRGLEQPQGDYLMLIDACDWVIIGCESGPKRRPMKLEWALDLVRQCQEAEVAVFVKQVDIDGKVSKDPSEWPGELRVREYPE